MKMSFITRIVGYIVILLFTSVLFSCKTEPKLIDVDPAFSQYIDAYTSGVVSKKNTVRIQLAADVPTTHTINETLKDKLFSFSPAVKGKAYWLDARTIEFKPDNDLTPGQLYEVSFHLGNVIKVSTGFDEFKFNIRIIKPSFEVNDFGLRSNNKTDMNLSGQILTADVEQSSGVEKLLIATVNGKTFPISWQHNETAKEHQFNINNISRTNAEQKLILQWKGDAINSGQEGEKEITIPALGDFKLLDVKASGEDEQYALVQFSDPISSAQNLDGLISISDVENPSYTILGSEIKVYVSGELDGSHTVNVLPGIENISGDKLKQSYSSNIFFENRLPHVTIKGRGNILPSSTGKLLLPFEAVNLKAVDVSIIKIYENNIAQFLQVNDMNGDQDLRRVGRPVKEATIKLDEDNTLNLHHKNTFSLDIDKFIRTEPGAIYHITIGFRPEYSLYACDSMTNDNTDNYYSYTSNENAVDEDQDFWDRYDNYYPYGYNWNERNNPCYRSYYNKEKFATRNILASNIGITAKYAAGQSLLVAVNDLVTTDPMKSVNLQVLNYQQQIMATAVSDADGLAMIDFSQKNSSDKRSANKSGRPYLLIAKQGNQFGYLKLDDGSSLPLGRFDVGGAEIKNGIKGYIFGERGVWRPGDSLFISCIINDKNNPLPADYPLEMELVSPRGLLYKRIVQTNAANGFNVFRTATDADAPTGNWICRVKAGGAVFEKKVKIETVMPNRLKINLDFGSITALGKDASIKGELSARWLFGATAQNLKARIDVQLYKKKTKFPRLDNYIFDNPTANFQSQSKTIFDGTLSADGTASVNPSFNAGEDAPGQLLANLVVKVFEPGGNFSIDNFSMPFNPYSSYVGVEVPQGDRTWGFLQSGKTHRFNIADVNVDGKFLQGDQSVQVQLYRIQWRWWWDEADDLTNFTQDEYKKFIKKDTVHLSNGKGFYDIKMDDDNWGRYLILVKDLRSGHTAGSTFFVDDYSWQTRAGDSDPSAAAMLSFTADKEKYNVGDNVNLSIPSSKGGRALISIESGSKVLKTYWVNTEQGQTKFSFKAEKEYSPNVYVNVSLLQPHAQTINDLPIRMYGVIPVMVDDKNTVLKPVISMADVIRPEVKNSITVSEASNKKMTYVIALVDDGLLDLTHFSTPNPRDVFYAREALGVKSWDVFDDVIGAFGEQMQRILTIGGDEEAVIASNTRRANRFKPVVEFLGPFTLNGGSNTHSFVLPAYMGSIRAMVVAAGDGAYGMADKDVTVKKPLMILPTLPRVVGPGEEIKIPVTVFATTNNIKNVSLSLQSNPLISGSSNQTISFTKPGEQQVYFSAKVNTSTGIGNIKIIASGGGEQSVYQTEIDVRNPNPYTTQVSETTLQPGQSWNSTVSMIGDAQSSRATLEISSIPAMDLQKRLTYLITYPHGCIEQITSAVFPQLVLNELLDLSDKQKADIDRNIRQALLKYNNFQQNDGGFSYWPNGTVSDEWGSNYAGHFLLTAQTMGYNISQNMLQQWKQYERLKAQTWNVTTAPWYGTDLMQAYRLYLLALAGSPELGAMNRLKEWKFLTPEGKWRLAAAYQLIGQQKIALQLISGLSYTFPERKFPGYTYGSDLRDQAMVLETLVLMKRNAEADQLVKTIAAKLSQENWYSTQTTAYSLIAVAEYAGSNKSGQKIIATGKSAGKDINLNTSSVVVQNTLQWQSNKADVQLQNKGNNVLFVRVINEGKPVSGENISFTNNPDLLRVNVSFVNANNNLVNIDSAKQGTDFVAKVVVTNPGKRDAYSNLALSEIFPSGWEILNTRLYNSEGSFQSSPSDYMDIRDDRVYYYFGLKQFETKTFYVQLNAAYPGEFYWPGIYCTAMYDNTISGGVKGKWVKVVE
ncbi:MAG: hypothetical protein JST21_03905 [Bacteroidetes bacterium]|nr:hypothetical protein [Bacteroidota bacterium]